MGKSLFFSDRVYEVDPESTTEATALHFGLSGASFAALLAFACFSDRTCLLNTAAACFGIALPCSLGCAMIGKFVLAGGWSTRTGRFLAFGLGLLSQLSGFAALALLSFHISRIAGSIFLILGASIWIGGWLFARSHDRTCAQLEQRLHDHPELGKIQPPLE